MNKKLLQELIKFEGLDKKTSGSISWMEKVKTKGREDSIQILKFFPYKPALILSLIRCEGINIFNKLVNIRDEGNKVAETYYRLLMKSETYFNTVSIYKNSKEWGNEMGFKNSKDNKIRKSVISQIFQSPARYLKIIKKNNKGQNCLTLNMFTFENEQEKYDAIKHLEDFCVRKLVEIIPEYNEFRDLNSILDYGEPDTITMTINSIRRPYLFRFHVFNNWGAECLICKNNCKDVLEAAHLLANHKITSKVHQLDEHSQYNGIVLCKNHHALFDKYAFTFDKEWQVILNKDEKFNNEYIKEIVKVYKKIDIKKINGYNQYDYYMDYHRKEFQQQIKK